MSEETSLTARDIGVAENALRALLTKILGQSEQKLEYAGWVALQMISKSPAPIAAEQLGKQLTGALKVDENDAKKVLGELQKQELVSLQGESYILSANGKMVFDALAAKVQSATAQAFAGLEPADSVVAHRVVTLIAKQADDLLNKKETF